MRFCDWVMFHAQSRPNSIALSTPVVRLSYGQLHNAMLSIANRLQECGVHPGSTVAVRVGLPGLHETILLALNYLGAISMSLPGAGAGQHKVPSGVQIDLAIVDSANDFPLSAPKVPADVSWFKASTPQHLPADSHFARGSDMCRIAISSGTTGEPKAVAISVQNIEPRLRQLAIAGVASGLARKTLNLLGPSTNLGFFIFLQNIWFGGTMFTNFANRTGRVIASRKIDAVFGSPASIGWLLGQIETDPVDCSSVKLVMSGGSVLPGSLARRIARFLCRHVVTGYGSTEVGFIAAAPVARLANIPGGAGMLIPSIDAEAVDADGNVLPSGSNGELRFRAEGMAEVYLNDPAASNEAFRDGWFYPGDIGSVSQDRLLRVLGRKGDVINAGGVKVNPATIEAALTGLGQVADAAVFAAPLDGDFDKIWVAVEPNGKTDEARLLTLCRERLRGFRVDQLLVVKALPRNAMGKVSRTELRQLVTALRKPSASSEGLLSE